MQALRFQPVFSLQFIPQFFTIQPALIQTALFGHQSLFQSLFFANLVTCLAIQSIFDDLVHFLLIQSLFFADLVTCSQFSHWMYFPLSLLEQIVCTHIYNYICFTKIALISLQWTIFTQISVTFSPKPPIQHTFSQKR